MLRLAKEDICDEHIVKVNVCNKNDNIVSDYFQKYELLFINRKNIDTIETTNDMIILSINDRKFELIFKEAVLTKCDKCTKLISNIYENPKTESNKPYKNIFQLNTNHTNNKFRENINNISTDEIYVPSTELDISENVDKYRDYNIDYP